MLNGLYVTNEHKISIPDDQADSFLLKAHQALIHPNESKLYRTLTRFFTTPKLKSKIKNITNACLKCCRCKERVVKYGHVKGEISAENFLDTISSDIFGPIKTKHYKTNRNCEYFYIITFTDVFSRYTLVDIIFDITASTVTKCFLKTIIKQLGAPKRILTDQGRQYISQVFKRMLEQYKIRHTFASAHNRSGN
ncbi:Transposon Tf2-8 polyprotein [Dictyocoela roeselum]|nr:Transposon Tf2-8 polyprotein [Dictyocoela roeselum]